MTHQNPAWPHSPLHKFCTTGTFMVTAGTYQKLHYFKSEESLNFLQQLILTESLKYGWEIQAWAIFSNHYHFIAISQKGTEKLQAFIRNVHSKAAIYINSSDNTIGRKVWHNYWDTQLTNQKSYMARLCYVHGNPVKHKLVDRAANYRWCSAWWFENYGEKSFVDSVYRFKTDKVVCFDEF